MKVMKKFVVLMLAFFSILVFVGVWKVHACSMRKYVSISKTNFPDDNFRKYIKKYDRNKDNRFSGKEIKAVTELDLRSDFEESIEMSAALSRIKSIKGMGYFTNLKKVLMSNYKIKTVTISNPELEVLSMAGEFTKLNLSKCKKLKHLGLSGYEGTTLDLRQFKKLEVLIIGSNTLIEYNKLHLEQCKKLKELHLLNDVRASEMDLTIFPELTDLILKGTVEKLDVHGLKKLKNIDCYSAGISEIDLKNCNNLRCLYIYQNPIKTLDLTTNVNLKELCCFETNIASLNCTNNLKLKRIYCDEGVTINGVDPATVKIDRWKNK